MHLSDFIDRLGDTEPTLVFANRRTITQPTENVIKDLFDEQPIDVVVADIENLPSDQMVVFREGEFVAASPVHAFVDSILLSDPELFTQSGDLSATEIPDAVVALEDTKFLFDGSMQPSKEKLIFILISRFIEKRALESQGGTLRTGFQEISRLRDERGTSEVYRRLGIASVDTHIYGALDWIPPIDIDVVVHGGSSDEFRDHWFVVFEPAETSEDSNIALLAEKLESYRWRAVWSSDETFVTELSSYIARNM